MDFTIKPIGIIKTPFTSNDKIPIQPNKSEVIAEVKVFPEYSAGLDSLEGFSHAILLYWFHKAQKPKLKVTPFLDTEKRGIFSTRAPSRPNPIGISIVRILEIDNTIVRCIGADMLNDTPLIDIKPFVPEFDNRLDATSGWLTQSLSSEKQGYLGDSRFLE